MNDSLASPLPPSWREGDRVRHARLYPPHLISQCVRMECASGHRVIILNRDGYHMVRDGETCPVCLKPLIWTDKERVEPAPSGEAEPSGEAKP